MYGKVVKVKIGKKNLFAFFQLKKKQQRENMITGDRCVFTISRCILEFCFYIVILRKKNSY